MHNIKYFCVVVIIQSRICILKSFTLFHKFKTRKEPDFLINKINYRTKKKWDNSAVLREKEKLEQLHVRVLIISKFCKCTGMLHEWTSFRYHVLYVAKYMKIILKDFTKLKRKKKQLQTLYLKVTKSIVRKRNIYFFLSHEGLYTIIKYFFLLLFVMKI